LEWTVLHRVKDAWCVERRGSFDLAPGDGGEVALPKAAAKAWKGWLALGLDGEGVLAKVVRLPSADPGEVREMAEFQADRFSPYPMETMGLGAEILKTEGEESLVALAMAKSEDIEAAGRPFQAAGSMPDGIDLTLLGWWRAMKDAGKAGESGDWLGVRLEAAGGAAGAVYARDGVPLWLGALPPAPEADGGTEEDGGEAAPAGTRETPEEWAAACADELEYALTSLEAEWGAAAGAGAVAEVWGEPEGRAAAEALSAALAKVPGVARVSCGTPAEDEAPRASEGLARRFLERNEGAAMNLAPAAWAEADAERRLVRGFWRTAAAVLVLWALAVAGFLTLLNLRGGQLARLEADVRALEEPALEVRALKGKLVELSQYADRTTSPLECLRVVAENLPEGIEMNSFVYAKGQDLKIRGEARTAQRVYDFVTALEETGMFPEVRNDGVNTRGGQNAYSLTLVLPGGEGGGEGGTAP